MTSADVFHSFSQLRHLVHLLRSNRRSLFYYWEFIILSLVRATMHWIISSAISWALAAGAGYGAYLVYTNSGKTPSDNNATEATEAKPSRPAKSKKAKAKKNTVKDVQEEHAKPSKQQKQKKTKAKTGKHGDAIEDPNAPLPPKEEEPLPERVEIAPPTQELSDSEAEEDWEAVEKKQRERKAAEPEMYPDSPVAAAGTEDTAFYTVAARRHKRAKDAQMIADERKAAKNRRKREKQKEAKAQEDALQKARLEAYRAQQRAAGVRYSTNKKAF